MPVHRRIWGGIKDAGKWTWDKVDKIDDALYLKQIVQIGQFIPGPQQPFVKGLAMIYAGSDAIKGTKEGNPLKTLMAMGSMYGTSKIGSKTAAATNEAKRTSASLAGAGESIPPALMDSAAAAASPAKAGFDAKRWAGASLMGTSRGMREQGLAERYAQQQAQSQEMIRNNFSLRPTIGQQQGRQDPFRAIRNPYMPNQRLPQFAGGGIAGVPRLPDNFEGYVDRPHIVSLGERGTEVVVPLWKLMQQTRRY